MTSLPHGLVARPLRETGLDAVVSMVNTCELHDTGEVMLERADLVADAGAEGFDPSADWIGIFEDDRIVGWGILEQRTRLVTDVHPDARGVAAWVPGCGCGRRNERGRRGRRASCR